MMESFEVVGIKVMGDMTAFGEGVGVDDEEDSER